MSTSVNGMFTAPPRSDDPPSVACLERRRPELLSMLLRMRFSYQDAQDAVQEAIMRAFEWIADGKVAGIKNRRAWLRTVAVRAAQTITRRRRECKLRSKEEPIILPFRDLEQAEEDQQRIDAIYRALGLLPEPLRQVFSRCAVEGRSIREAAAEMRLPVGTVNARLIRARRAIREQLRAAGFDVPDSD
jgi:RNA polymerase sigma-70 factor (ECF subfamily)